MYRVEIPHLRFSPMLVFFARRPDTAKLRACRALRLVKARQIPVISAGFDQPAARGPTRIGARASADRPAQVVSPAERVECGRDTE